MKITRLHLSHVYFFCPSIGYILIIITIVYSNKIINIKINKIFILEIDVSKSNYSDFH